MRSLVFISILFCVASLQAQVSFHQAYTNHPQLPEGLLEAVAWTNTRMQHLENQQESCSGYPRAYGVMGLHDDGEGYFLENGVKVAAISGISVEQQKSDPNLQIEAYASAIESFLPPTSSVYSPSAIYTALLELSEIPDSGIVNHLARDMQAYEILRFMRDPQQGLEFGFTAHHFNLPAVFGSENFAILSAKKITLSAAGITNEQGQIYLSNANASVQYAPALWNPAPTCNFSSRNGVPVSAITLHTIQGSYAGAISWSQNCASNVSFHYVIRSSDGQVTQMLLEEDKGWHVGSENPYTIGYEHEGYVNDPIWYTEAMYNASADLSRDIIASGYGIPAVRTYYGSASATIDVLGGCTKIKGHQHYPNQTHTDPGINWNWEKYYRLVNNSPTITTLTNASSAFYDSGGMSGNYQDDEREVWLIQPPNAQFITLNFTSFDLEPGYDNLFIYDGDSIGAPLLGSFTGTNSPSQVQSSGGALTVEFRSDCGTTAAGWQASYTTTLSDNTPPQSSIVQGPVWHTADFTVDFIDTDSESGIAERYYLVSEKELTENAPKSAGNLGFVNESFEDGVAQWTNVTGTFSPSSGAFSFNDPIEQNSNTYLSVEQNSNQSYLFSWEQQINGSGSNQRAGMHFFCDDPNQSNRGNSYFVYLRTSDLVQIYSVTNNTFTLEADLPYTIDSDVTYQCKVQYDPADGWIRVFVDGDFVGAWQDATPLTAGNSISLRSGGCAVDFDKVRVYQSRSNQVIIPAGPGSPMSIESEGAIPTGFVYALAVDTSNNWSSEVEESYLLDFSAPEILQLNDGSGTDIDSVFVATLEANWTGEDIHSGIANYEVAIGTLPNLNDVVDWTSNGLTETFASLLTAPINNEFYYLSVRTTNGAGLEQVSTSDGQEYIANLNLGSQHLSEVSIYPNPAMERLEIHGIEGAFEILMYDAAGKLCLEQEMNGNETLSISALASGMYQLVIRSGNQVVVKKLEKR